MLVSGRIRPSDFCCQKKLQIFTQDIDTLHSYFQPKTSGRSEGRPTTPGSGRGRGSMVGTPRAVFTDSVARTGWRWEMCLGKWCARGLGVGNKLILVKVLKIEICFLLLKGLGWT